MDRPSAGAGAPGFTLVELLVTVVVLAIVAVIAVPSLRSFSINNQVAAARSSFAAAIALAHSEAARQGQPVALAACAPGVSAEACLPGPSGNEWSPGWRVRLASDSDSSTLRQADALSNEVKLSGDVTSISFSTTGAVQPPALHVFTVCPATGGSNGYTVRLEPSGVADVETKTDCS